MYCRLGNIYTSLYQDDARPIPIQALYERRRYCYLSVNMCVVLCSRRKPFVGRSCDILASLFHILLLGRLSSERDLELQTLIYHSACTVKVFVGFVLYFVLCFSWSCGTSLKRRMFVYVPSFPLHAYCHTLFCQDTKKEVETSSSRARSGVSG